MASKKPTIAEELNKLLSVVDNRLIITFSPDEKAVYVGGKKVEEGQLLALKAEAEYILNSDLWKIIFETPKELAMRAMFVAGESLDDMKKGRAMLYTLDTQKLILETLASAKKV
jgi:hypothetical protein